MEWSARRYFCCFLYPRVAYVNGDDVCHRRKGGESGADFGIEAGILYLLRLLIVITDLSANCTIMSTALRYVATYMTGPIKPKDPSER